MAEDGLAAPAIRRAFTWRAFAQITPGLLLSALIASSAYVLSLVTPAPAVIIALVLGVSCSRFYTATAIAPGIDASATSLLRLGVVLLGVRITFADMADLGPNVALITIGALAFALAIGLGLARWLKLDLQQSIILSGATAICGASAALAVATALPKSSRTDADTAGAIAGVTVIGTACMLLYPFVAHLLSFDARTTGVFLGATLHEVAQAVGAGYAVSPESGEAATAVKLLRVACLAPVVLIVGATIGGGRARGVSVPPFLVGFAIMAALSSASLLPHAFVTAATATSQWLLLAAIAALGVKTSLSRFRAIGARPFILLAVQTAALGAIVAGGLLLATR